MSGVMKQPHIVVKDAFLLSVKLSFLLKRITCHVKPKQSIHKLRDKIKTCFPEKAALSKDGVATFSQVLPAQENTEEYQFAQRIIAGLSKIWTEGRFEDSRNCLEYLSRRKLDLSQNITDLLWGVIHAYFQNDAIVHATYEIYTWNETKKSQKDRIGLLWSIFYWVQIPKGNVATLTWRDEEQRVLKTISEKHKDLWQQLHEEEETEDMKGIDLITSFEPREVVATQMSVEPYCDERKQIDLRKPKASKHVKEKNSQVNKSNRHETNHLDPRYWRVYTSKEGA